MSICRCGAESLGKDGSEGLGVLVTEVVPRKVHRCRADHQLGARPSSPGRPFGTDGSQAPAVPNRRRPGCSAGALIGYRHQVFGNRHGMKIGHLIPF